MRLPLHTGPTRVSVLHCHGFFTAMQCRMTNIRRGSSPASVTDMAPALNRNATGEPRRLDTMPSQPSLQASANRTLQLQASAPERGEIEAVSCASLSTDHNRCMPDIFACIYAIYRHRQQPLARPHCQVCSAKFPPSELGEWLSYRRAEPEWTVRQWLRDENVSQGLDRCADDPDVPN